MMITIMMAMIRTEMMVILMIMRRIMIIPFAIMVIVISLVKHSMNS